MLAWLITAILALAGLFVAVESHGFAPFVLNDTTIIGSIIGALIVGCFVTFWPTSGGHGSTGLRIAKAVVIVGVAAVGLAGLYFGRDLSQLTRRGPEDAEASSAVTYDGPVAVRLRSDQGGRFTTQAQINGAAVDMVVDTGATQVMLRSSDAQAAGIDIAKLQFDTAIATANGTTYAAPARLRTVQIGLLQIEDIDVLVAKPGTLNKSLLGMSFLTRLASYQIAGEFMTLRN